METLKMENYENTKEKKSQVLCLTPMKELLLKTVSLSGKLKEEIVRVKPSFPWSAPNEYLSVLNSSGEVLFVVESLDKLDDSQREAVEYSLRQAGFVFKITKVLKIDEEFELRLWKVQTLQGLRSFQTSFESWPRRMPDGSFLVEDVSGDLYRLDNKVEIASGVHSALAALID